jgi:hypothetical protein
VDLHGRSVTWHLFDVGGARGQRHSWVSIPHSASLLFFDLVDIRFPILIQQMPSSLWLPLALSTRYTLWMRTPCGVY